MSSLHPIRVAAKKTGLSPHLIRAWERRYGAITPSRTNSNRRLYSEDDIRRLMLLKKITDDGETISQVANLTDTELAEMASATESGIGVYPQGKLLSAGTSNIDEIMDICSRAVTSMDSRLLESTLNKAAVTLSMPVLLEKVISPLLDTIGSYWFSGKIRVLHEHMASSVIRTFLGNLLVSYNTQESAPGLISTTPAYTQHELGALLAALTASTMGWNVTYLGPNMPADEIASAAVQQKARAVALSIVYPDNDPRINSEIYKLRKFLGDRFPIIVGGNASATYEEVLKGISAIRTPDLESLRKQLGIIR